MYGTTTRATETLQDHLLREVEARRMLAQTIAEDVETTLDTLADAGITLTGPQLLTLRERKADHSALSALLHALGRRLEMGEEITRSHAAWTSVATLGAWRALDSKTSDAMQGRAFFTGGL